MKKSNEKNTKAVEFLYEIDYYHHLYGTEIIWTRIEPNGKKGPAFKSGPKIDIPLGYKARIRVAVTVEKEGGEFPKNTKKEDWDKRAKKALEQAMAIDQNIKSNKKKKAKK